mmetsp:Transcript_29707/g.78853  ORF Transcript_29707/g.78853 Transcript_29707/m.78853 type:complete len:462 (-) Transcript_29707:284-1669(-)
MRRSGAPMRSVDLPGHIPSNLVNGGRIEGELPEFFDNIGALSVAATCCAVDAASAVKRDYSVDQVELFAGHIKTTSLILITAFVLCFTVITMRDVLVPLALAIVLVCLFEPLFCFLRHPGNSYRRFRDPTWKPEPEESPSALQVVKGKLGIVFALVGCLLSVILIFLVTISMLIYSVIIFPNEKYTNSSRYSKLSEYIDSFSDDVSAIEDSSATSSGLAVSALSLSASIASTIFVMMLFFTFLLLEITDEEQASGVHVGFSSKVKRSVKRYVRVKTCIAVLVGVSVWLILAVLKVDLPFLFGFLAFVLNFIPHIGYTVSVLIPLALVYLDPTKNWMDVFLCFVFLTLVYQFFGIVVEPRYLARWLDLHPLVIITMLAFWTGCWGPVGTIFSTPITCIVRLLLLEFSHPYAAYLAGLLEGQWGGIPGHKQSLGPVREPRIAEHEAATLACINILAPPVVHKV